MGLCILCSAETHFFKQQGERKIVCCLQKRMFSPGPCSSCELDKGREKTSCKCFSDSTVTSNNSNNNNKVTEVILIL